MKNDRITAKEAETLTDAMEVFWEGLTSHHDDCTACETGLFDAGPTEWQLGVMRSDMPFDAIMVTLWAGKHADKDGSFLMDADGLPLPVKQG